MLFRSTDYLDERFYKKNPSKHNINKFSSGGEEALKIANKKHDVVSIKIYDKRETELPSVGLLKLKDAETGQLIWVDTSNSNVRERYLRWTRERESHLREIFTRSGVDAINIRTDQSYIKPLMNFFKKRGSRK